MNDIKAPPFTDGQKEVIEATERIANGKLICDVDDDITDIKELLNDTIKRIEEPTNEEWFCNLDTEDKAREISDMTAQGYWSKELVERWLKEKYE